MDNFVIEKALVSFIVPAYNVENYIEKCIDSLVSQTHKKIEIIVVNDGSTDDTLKIIETKFLDSRIKIINQQNGGVSSARNTGLKVASGDFVVFVDGDDYVSCEYAEYMLSLFAQSGADFCLSKKCFTKTGEKQDESLTVEIINNEMATALLLSPKVIVGCWNKMFRMDFLKKNNLVFSTNLFYGEGLNFITTASQIANCICVGNKKVYYYRRNNESSATTKFDIQKIYNGEKSLNTIKNNMLFTSKKVDTMFNLHLATYYLGAIVRLKTNNLVSKYKLDYKKWRKIVLLKFFQLLFKRTVSLYRKTMLIIGAICPGILVYLDKKRRKKITENSVI